MVPVLWVTTLVDYKAPSRPCGNGWKHEVLDIAKQNYLPAIYSNLSLRNQPQSLLNMNVTMQEILERKFPNRANVVRRMKLFKERSSKYEHVKDKINTRINLHFLNKFCLYSQSKILSYIIYAVEGQNFFHGYQYNAA